MGRILTASMRPQLLGISYQYWSRTKTGTFNRTTFLKLESVVGCLLSEMDHALHKSLKDHLHNVHPSTSTCIFPGWRAAQKVSCLGDILVSSPQGQVICDVQCQAPSLRPPTPPWVIRKAIRRNHTLPANYCLSQGGLLWKLDLESKPTCAALSPPLLALQGFIRCFPRLCSFKRSPENIEHGAVS